MANMLYHAHSGLRFLVLLAGIAALLYLAYGWATRRAYDKPARILPASFVGLAWLQIILGVLLVASGIFYPSLIGHISMMVLGTVAAQVLTVMGKKTADARRGYLLSLVGVITALVLILLGIAAIGRGPFQVNPRPSMEKVA